MIFNITRMLVLGGSLCSVSLSGGALAGTDLSAIVFNPDYSFAYVGELSATQIQFCSVLANHQLGGCQVTGPTSFIMPSRLTFTSQGRYLYVVDQVYHAASKCSVDATTGQILDCSEVDLGFGEPSAVSADPKVDYLYVAHSTGSVGVSVCDLNPQGDPKECRAISMPFKQPEAMAIRADGSHAYILSSQAKKIWSCDINLENGQFRNCDAVSIDVSHDKDTFLLAHNIYANVENLNNEYFITSCDMTETGTMAYVNQYPDGSAYRCLISQNTADFRDCFRGGNPLGYATPLNIVLNSDSTRAYIYSAGLVRWSCNINSKGVLTQCDGVNLISSLPWEEMTP
jgi:hypothetical protein